MRTINDEVSTSVRRLRRQISDKELRYIIDAGCFSWKNFQSYSIIVVRSKKKKPSLTWCPKPFGSLRPSCFCWRPQSSSKRCLLHTRRNFTLKAEISDYHAALAGAKLSLISWKFGLWRVIIGWSSITFNSPELFKLPDYTYRFRVALGLAKNHAVKPFALWSGVAFWGKRINREQRWFHYSSLWPRSDWIMPASEAKETGVSAWHNGQELIRLLINYSKKRN